MPCTDGKKINRWTGVMPCTDWRRAESIRTELSWTGLRWIGSDRLDCNVLRLLHSKSHRLKYKLCSLSSTPCLFTCDNTAPKASRVLLSRHSLTSTTLVDLASPSMLPIIPAFHALVSSLPTNRYALVEKVRGEQAEDSRVLDSVMLSKDITYPETRRPIQNARILLLDCTLEKRKDAYQSPSKSPRKNKRRRLAVRLSSVLRTWRRAVAPALTT
jgi:hypothetical protein